MYSVLQTRIFKNKVLSTSILLNAMFHAPMGRFQLELIYNFIYFSTVVPSNSYVFLSCRPFVVNMKFSTGLVGVENVVLTTKGLQERNAQLLYGMTVKNR